MQEQLKTLSCAQAENQTEPENAYVAYQNGQFVIVPETVGSKLNIKEAYKVLNAAVDAGQTSVNFSDTPEAYVNAEVTQMIRHCSLHWKHVIIIQKQVLPIHLAVRQQL